jgi:hypothetical protein
MQLRTQFRLGRDDYRRSLMSRPRSIWHGVVLSLMPIVGFPLLIFGSIGIYFERSRAISGWAFVAISGLILVLGRPLLIWIELRREYKGPQDFELFVQESGIEVKSRERTSQYNWSDFSYFTTTPKHFILFFPSDALLFPKRAFSAEERDAFSSILWRHVPDRVRGSHS